VKKKTSKEWKKFQESGLLWFINRVLHTFGYAIVLRESDDGTVIEAYPERVSYRGFPEESEDRGFKRISRYLLRNAEDLYEEIRK
jgi:hypothetical protein